MGTVTVWHGVSSGKAFLEGLYTHGMGHLSEDLVLCTVHNSQGNRSR